MTAVYLKQLDAFVEWNWLIVFVNQKQVFLYKDFQESFSELNIMRLLVTKQYQVLQSVFLKDTSLDFLAQKKVQNLFKIIVVHNDLEILLLELLQILHEIFIWVLKTEITSNYFCQVFNA